MTLPSASSGATANVAGARPTSSYAAGLAAGTGMTLLWFGSGPMRTAATVPTTVAFSVFVVFATIVCATRTRPSSLPAALVSPGVCGAS